MNFNKGQVSIVMPAYNSEKYLFDTVKSVISQSYSNWELIIIDDCSKDSTKTIIEKLSQLDFRIKSIFLNKNSGAGIARNAGIRISEGQYLAFLDADDIWSEEKLELQVKHLSSNNAAICHTSFRFIDECGESRQGGVKVSPQVCLKDNLKNTEIGTSTAIIDRYKIDRNIEFSSIRARQDLKLWIQLLGLGYTSFGLEKSLVKYRVRSGSVSSNKIKMLILTFGVYMGVNQLSYFSRISCYCCYVLNAIRKRG